MAKFVPKFFGSVENQKLVLRDQQTFDTYVAGLHGEVEVVVRPWEKKRTIRQNSFYWAWLKLVGDETGYLDDELHELFKQKFLDKRKLVVLGEEIDVYPSTTRLTKIEFGKYIEKCSMFCGVALPNEAEVDV